VEFVIIPVVVFLITAIVKWLDKTESDKVQQLEAENARLKKINRSLVENDVLWGGLDKTVQPLPKYKPQQAIPGVNNLDDVIAYQKKLAEVESLKDRASGSWWRSSNIAFTALPPPPPTDDIISGSATRVPYGFFTTQYDEE
jgi:hypothetical protein